jgi:hypothetical protein
MAAANQDGVVCKVEADGIHKQWTIKAKNGTWNCDGYEVARKDRTFSGCIRVNQYERRAVRNDEFSGQATHIVTTNVPGGFISVSWTATGDIIVQKLTGPEDAFYTKDDEKAAIDAARKAAEDARNKTEDEQKNRSKEGEGEALSTDASLPKPVAKYDIKPVEKWTIQDVLEWLTYLGPVYKNYQAAFEQNGVDGLTLVAISDGAEGMDMLMKDLNISSRLHAVRMTSDIQRRRGIKKSLPGAVHVGGSMIAQSGKDGVSANVIHAPNGLDLRGQRPKGGFAASVVHGDLTL